jgi:hypothetical protein
VDRRLAELEQKEQQLWYMYLKKEKIVIALRLWSVVHCEIV